MITDNNLEEQLRVLNAAQWEIKKLKNRELYARLDEEVKPLTEQVLRLKQSIESEVREKYSRELESVDKAIADVTKQLNQKKIASAQNSSAWYPVGTVVYKWTQKTYFSNPRKTDQKGVVVVYDGTQVLAEKLGYHNTPAIGDIIVLPYKADGTIGKKCERISECSHINLWSARHWFIDGDTPDDNILTRQSKVKDDVENEYIF